MKKMRIKRSLLLFVLAVAALVTTTVPAHATFIKDLNVLDPAPVGDRLFLEKNDVGANSFSGFVGAQSSGPKVDAIANVNVTTGSGWANIKPDKDATLTVLTFTPDIANTTKFSDFSFRAQLLWDLKLSDHDTGQVDVIVTDQNNLDSTIHFTGLKGPNADFDVIGVVSIDDEWIKSVKILTTIGTSEGALESFKEVKQVSFSSVPEPSTFLLLGAGLGGLWIWRRRK